MLYSVGGVISYVGVLYPVVYGTQYILMGFGIELLGRGASENEWCTPSAVPCI